ncbi:general secretion pathway protein GspB [Lysobacter sp. GCM10012299]|uniref:general secretion pathway protein GspB n=1 Tax=Lysobacter sp. GCM10012299 TaxID=3317333 RepID=UPI0036225499
MSLILDALRKSEAERRRGQAPDLYAELPPLVPRTATRRPLWPWWLAGGFAVLASLWLLRDVTSTAGVVTAPVVDAPAAAANDLADSTAAVGPAVPPATAPLPKPGPRFASEPSRSALPEARPAREAMATVAVPPETGPAPSQPAPEPVLPSSSQAPVQPPVQVASVTPPAPAATPAAAAPLRLADLSAGEREQLPALKISMHMWAPSPDQRFAIIDGARVGQGDRVGDAVVEEISADSVVLNWHGQRVALPIH